MKAWIAFFLGVACLAGPVQAQRFVEGKDRGAVRDGVLHPPTGRLYVPAYNENQVWAIDPASLERLSQAPVGRGPTAVALSADYTVLAVVNRGADSVTLLRLPEHAVLATVPTGKGPTAIAALPQGGFAVVNTYGDSISLIDKEGVSRATVSAGVVGVPTGIAVAGDRLGVIGRGAAELSLLSLAGVPEGTVALPAAPIDIAGTPAGLVVSTGTELLLIDPAARAITRRVPATAAELTASEGVIYAFEPATLSVTPYAGALEAEAVWLAPAGTQLLVASAGTYLALSPQARSWQVWNAANLGLQAPAAPAPVLAETPDEAPAQQDEIVVAEALPAEPTPTQETVIQEVPFADERQEEVPLTQEPDVVASGAPPVPEVSARAADQPETMDEYRMAPETDSAGRAPAAGLGSDQPLAPRPGQVRKYPIQTESVRAPSNRRPSAVPMRELNHRTVADALVQPTEFGSVEAGFQPPDWTEPFRDIEFERMVSAPNANVVELEGQVRLRLGDMYFGADRFSYDREVGSVQGTGAIEIRQRDSLLTADEFRYTIPGADALPEATDTPFAPVLTDQELERRRLTLGTLYARNVYIDEPTRFMSAQEVNYDFGTDSGEMQEVHGQAGIYFYGADKIRILGPASIDGEDVWVTTCDHDPPHYRVRLSRAKIENGVVVGGSNARLQVGGMATPFFLPKWRRSGVSGYPWTFDFDSGRRAELGSYLNVGQRFEITPDIALGPRIFVTEKEGVGFGADASYDFMESPASWLYRTQGEVHGLYTTEDRGYIHWYHRYEYDENLVVRMQAEHWSDSEFYKDFFYDAYRNRTAPRSFANVTYRQDDYIATGTVQAGTHSWANEKDRLPEVTFHLLERPVLDRLYLSFDTVTGYNDRSPYGDHGGRSVNIARLSYDFDPAPGLSITPFVELEGTWYSKQRDDDSSATRLSTLAGVTAQSRFHREYAGRWGFSAFKHVVVPSITYSYQPESSLKLSEAPYFDQLDSSFGRSRIESKIDNIVYGRDAQTSEVWQVARLTLYQGNDLWNEVQKSADYEFEMDIRPVQWAGFQLVGEHHDVNEDFRTWGDRFRYNTGRLYQRIVGRPFNDNLERYLDSSFDDYSRLLAQVYYEDEEFNARLGYAYTETRGEVYNREVLYGLGYQINEKWGIGFEHRYDFEDDELRSQSYEIRRSLHCWETAIRFRDRESGFDIDLTFNIKAFPGTRLKL